MVSGQKLRTYLDCCKPRNLNPNMEVRSISEIPIGFLKEKKIKGMVLDVDNTLCEKSGRGVYPMMFVPLRKLTENFRCCLLTDYAPERRDEVRRSFDYLELAVVDTDVRKPFGYAFSEACNLISCMPYETAMVGDRLLTDIAGANRWGMYTIKVEPFSRLSEPLHQMVARGFESLLLRVFS
jgi:HAD superfamily phosphatase (TIGR01668 family)